MRVSSSPSWTRSSSPMRSVVLARMSSSALVAASFVHPDRCIGATKGVQSLNDINDPNVNSINSATHAGVIANEHARGVRIDTADVNLHADAIRHGCAHITPCARRSGLVCIVTDVPTLFEPVYVEDIRCPETAIGGIYNVINRRRGKISSEEQRRAPLCSSSRRTCRSSSRPASRVTCGRARPARRSRSEPSTTGTSLLASLTSSTLRWARLSRKSVSGRVFLAAFLHLTVSMRSSTTSQRRLFNLNEQTHHAFQFSKTVGRIESSRPSTVRPFP